MDYSVFYDKTNVNSIVEYSKKLEGKTFAEIISEKVGSSHDEIIKAYGNKARKGGLGNLLEEVYYGYKANSKQDADFEEAGVELKVTCYEVNKNGSLRAGERLVLTMISYDEPVEKDFFKSHAWRKMSSIMLIYYWRNKLLNSNLLYKIGYTRLFTPPEEDLIIIREDYEFIISKIEAGRAHELSEADTMYLGACTKGSTAAKSTVPQYYGNHTPAMKRAFCFKTSYMTYVLNHYVIGIEKEERIIKDAGEIAEKSFVDILMDRLSTYKGVLDTNIATQFGVNTINKGYRALLAYAMLGVKGNKAEEFIKANIEVKTIRLAKNGRNPEHFRLHDFDFKELASQEWEDSELYEQLESTQFLLVVYQETDKGIVYAGSQLWHMNKEQLEIVHQGWEAVKKKLNEGVTLTVEIKEDGGEVVHNDLPKITDNPIFHVRPHQQQAYYRLKDGSEHGKGTIANGNELPDGQYMPTHAYWLHSKFITSILDKRLINIHIEDDNP
jgi:DNA mismatch repair protein MutH